MICAEMRSQIVTASGQIKRNIKVTPFAFTEHGVTMLASVLRSRKAIRLNIAIVEAFVTLKEFTLNFKELAQQIKKLEIKYNKKFADIFEALKYLIEDKNNRDKFNKRRKIGFKN